MIIKFATYKFHLTSIRLLLSESRDVLLPNNWTNFLSLSENKADLGHFLSGELCSQASNEKEIVVAGGFRDEREVQLSKPTTDIAQLKATHEEADTRLVLHALNYDFDVVVVASKDTDVHFPNMQCEDLWMRSGTAKQRKYIPIRELTTTYQEVQQKLW